MCSSSLSQRASFVFGEVLCLVRPGADRGGSFGAGGDSAAAPCITILHSSRGWGASTTCSQAGVRAGLSGRLRLSSHDAEVMVVSQTHPPARSLLQPGSANPRDLSHTDPVCVWPFRVFGAGPARHAFAWILILHKRSMASQCHRLGAVHLVVMFTTVQLVAAQASETIVPLLPCW